MTTNRAHVASQKPLRIAVVAACPFPTLQGSQVLIRQHAQAMAARGHVVHIVAYHLGLKSALASEKVRLHRIPAIPLYKRMRSGPSLGKPLLDALLTLKLLRVARCESVDLFHAHNVEGVLAAWPVARLLRKPLVFHAHTLMETELPAYFHSPIARAVAARLGRWLDRILPRLADRTIVLSPEARLAFARLGTSGDRFVRIPPGIEHQDERDAIDDRGVRTRYALGDGPLAIYTGNLDPYQGLDDLLRAFSHVRTAVPEVQLIVASHAAPDGWLDLTGDSVRHIRVRSFGEAAALLAASDLAICPRPACMGYPIKLLNYMTAGKAILCAAGSARDIVHLHNGYIYPDGDVDALASGMMHLIRDRELSRRLAQNARRTIRKQRWSALAETFETLYHDLVNESVVGVAAVPKLGAHA